MNNEKIQNNIEDKILAKISTEHIEPKAKWKFLLKNSYFWLLGLATIILGALTIAVSIFVFENIRWELYKATHENLLTFLIDFIPYLWLMLFLGFVIFTQYLIKKTKHGYRYHLSIIVGSILVISTVLGIVFADLGLGQDIDQGLDDNLPFYQGIKKHNDSLWNDPNKGLLTGTISLVNNDFILTTEDNKDWKLITNNLNKDLVKQIGSDGDVRIVGVVKNDQFYVCGILPDFDDLIKAPPNPKIFFERNNMIERSIECEGVRPYARLLED
jgi:hypothetical protein